MTCAGIGVDLQHVQRLGRGDAKSLALTDREAMNAAVCTQRTAGLVDDRAAARAAEGARAGDERGIVAVRDEADLVTVGLLRDQQAEPTRACSRTGGLGNAPTGKSAPASCSCVEREQEVGLVLVRIRAASQLPAAVAVAGDRGVVARRDVRRTQPLRAIEQRRELQIAVAVRARDRRAARRRTRSTKLATTVSRNCFSKLTM